MYYNRDWEKMQYIFKNFEKNIIYRNYPNKTEIFSNYSRKFSFILTYSRLFSLYAERLAQKMSLDIDKNPILC